MSDADTVSTSPRPSHTTTYIALGCIVALLALALLGSVMNIGDHLFTLHPAVGWAFYGLLALLVVVGIIVPIVKVARRPIFSLYQLRDEKGRAKGRYCQLLADNLVANAGLSEEDIARVKDTLAHEDEADDLLISFFNERIVPAIDAETERAASTAFFVAAISRSPLVSTVTMLSLCLDLVRCIVEKCGFRPTNAGLARLYSRVMISALIVGGIEDSDLSELIGQLLGGGAGAQAGGLVIGAAAEGLVSAFLVFRVGIITKRWLTAEDGPAHMRSLRRASYKEALESMREGSFATTVTETLKQMTASTASAAVNAVADAAKDATNAVADAAREATSSVADAAREATMSVAGAIETAARPTIDAADVTAIGVRDAFRTAFGKARSALRLSDK